MKGCAFLTPRCVCATALFALLAAAAFADDVPMSGRVAVVKPERLAKFVSRSGTGAFPLPAPGSAEDPTIAGAELRLFDTESPGAGDASFVLHHSGWRGLGAPPGVAGYRYTGRDDVLDPDPKGTCRVVLLTEKVIRATCKGTTVTLTPPLAAAEGIRLGIPAGTASLRYCATFGGVESRNDAMAMKRRNAPALSGCAGVPQDVRPCGDTALACHGACSAGQTCTVNPLGQGSCECAPDTAVACEDTGGFPVPNLCGGSCPDGLSCATIDIDDVSFEIFCGCVPSDAVACGESSAPSCGGTCPAGLICQAGGLGTFSCACE